MQNYISLHLEDSWLRVFSYLEVSDILRLAQTCRTFAHITASKHLWISVLRRDVLSRNLLFPASCKDMEILNGSQVKMLVLRALRLNVHMTRNRPPSVIMPLHQSRSIGWVKIIRGHWLLVASSDSTCSVLSLWSVETLLAGRRPSPVAEAFLDAPARCGIVEVQDTQVVIALELRGNQTCIDVVTLAKRDDKITFVKLARLEGASRIRALRGDLVGYALHEERSVASIANWRTGAVHHLVRAPEMTGGCLGMAIDGEIAVVVTPVHVRVFRLSLAKDGGVQTSMLQRVLPMRYSVGFVDVAFRLSDAFISTTTPTPSLHLFISGQDGLFAFVLPKDDLLLQDADLELTLVWHPLATDSLYAREREKTAHEDALNEGYPYMDDSEPQFGTDCATASWIEGPCVVASAKYPVNLVMLTSRLLQRGAPPPTNSYYRIDGSKEVALYAMASRDYDDGLGLLAAGNAFGELVLYSLLPFKDLAAVHGALVDVPIPVYMSPHDMLPTIPPTWSRPVLNPCLCPPKAQCKPLTEWEAHQPPFVPEGWEPMWHQYYRYWAQFLPNVWGLAWYVENGFHYLGTAVPLLFRSNLLLFKSGGLFFLYDTEEAHLFVIDQTLHLEQIVLRLGPDQTTLPPDLPLTQVHCESTAGKPPLRFQGLWRWERREFGRDRWQEFEARGGDMGGAWWKEDKILPRQYPIYI